MVMGLILGKMEPNYDKWTVEGEHLKLIGFYRLVATGLTMWMEVQIH